MNTRRLLCLLAGLALGLIPARSAPAAEATTAPVPVKPGYKVMLKIFFDETGVSNHADVVESDDPTSDTVLNRIALSLAAKIKQAPQMKDGKPVPFSVIAPFDFPVAGDEGAAANAQPMPSELNGTGPVYPEDLADTGVVGGAILELIVGADGKVNKVTVMKASHPEFARSAMTAAHTWTFDPAMKDGKPVDSRIRIAVAYTTKGKDVDWEWRVAPRPNYVGLIVFNRPKGSVPPAAAATTPAPGVGK